MIDLLALPNNTKIITAYDSTDYIPGDIEFVIESEDFPVLEGNDIPRITPIYQRITSSAVEMKSWGLDD